MTYIFVLKEEKKVSQFSFAVVNVAGNVLSVCHHLVNWSPFPWAGDQHPTERGFPAYSKSVWFIIWFKRFYFEKLPDRTSMIHFWFMSRRLQLSCRSPFFPLTKLALNNMQWSALQFLKYLANKVAQIIDLPTFNFVLGKYLFCAIVYIYFFIFETRLMLASNFSEVKS